jgi:hypothetical protein
MRRTRSALLPLVALVALSAVSSAEGVAAEPRRPLGFQVYRDAGAETASAPDITSVVVADDDAGRLSLKLSFANRTRLRPSDLIVIGLNVDRDEQTGGPMGMDYALSATTAGAQLGVWYSSSWYGSGYLPVPGVASISVFDDSVTLTTTVGCLGALMAPRRPQLRFVVIAIANSDQPEESWVEDVAGPWSYRVNVSTKLGCGKVSWAFGSCGFRGTRSTAQLAGKRTPESGTNPQEERSQLRGP